MYEPKYRSQDEVDAVLNACVEAQTTGSRFPGMSYEDGVEAAINWLLNTGADDIHPLED